MKVFYWGYGGNSWQADQFRDEIETNGMQLITCHEYPNANIQYDKEKIFQYLDSVDAVILPSRKIQEAKSANRLALAWSRGKACVVGPLPAYLDYVKNGENGLIAYTREDWLKNLCLLRDDPKLRVNLGLAGLQLARQIFNPKMLTQHFFDAVNACGLTLIQIIIPHYSDRLDYLEEAIKSALESDGPSRDILVVSSSRRSPEDLIGSFKDPRVRCYHQADRLNFSQANNIGFYKANPEATHFLLLNDDAVLSNNALKNFVDLAGNKEIILNPYSNCDYGWLHKDHIEVDGMQLVPGMQLDQLKSRLPSIKGIKYRHEEFIPAPFCAMYCTFFPKSVYEKVGDLNESYKNGGEDADFCYRAKALGIGTFWTKGVFCLHFGGKTRKFSEQLNYKAHHDEDSFNNTLLNWKWGNNKKRVCIWTGPSWGNKFWGLDSYKEEGIGGSETCAGRLAEEFAKNGCYVLMLGTHHPKTKNYDNGGIVEMLPDGLFKPSQEYFDLFIASRSLNCIDKNVRAKKVVAWVHDIFLLSGKDVSPFHIERVDKFLCLSEWHKKFFSDYHKISEDKIDIVPNGINTELFQDAGDLATRLAYKEYGRIHYSSSPDRGLDNILYLLPWILDKHPEVKLHVYYGFDNWVISAKHRKDDSSLRLIEKIQKDMENFKDNVVYHGKISQQQLAEDWKKAYVWFYPTNFSETFCLTAKEAQYSATPILCSNVAALQTTVGQWGIRIDGHPYSKESREKYLEEMLKLLDHKNHWQWWAERSYAGAREGSWSEVFKEHWSQLIKF